MTKVLQGAGALAQFECSALIVVAFDSTELSGSVKELDGASNGYFQRLLREGDLQTAATKTNVYYSVPGIAARCVIVVGGGPRETWETNSEIVSRCAGAASKILANRDRKAIGIDFGDMEDRLARVAVAGAMNACVGQDLFRAEKTLKPFQEMHWWNISPAAIRQGLTLGEGILLTRELVNLPANLLYPEEFARRAAEVAVSCGLELEVWDELRLRKERCSALLAVAAGSARAPRLLVLRYRGKRTQPPLALVGKGVTFDSGGLSIKPTEGMLSMKCDMAGAATVLGAMQVLAELQVETPVVAVVGLVENMISGSSYKLGDVLTARSGKTIEIHNTDAEGRLVLADALNVALDESPAAIIDLATLTGACLVALGADIAGLMGNDPAWQQRVQSAAERAGEYVWPLPMHDHFREQIQSKVADIKNVGEGRWGGAITAAKFLQEFVGNTPWAHIDIAGPAFLSAPKPHIDAGATGAFVHTLLTLAEDFEPI